MKKILAASGIGAALIAGPLAGAGTANASDMSYLQMLNYRGFTIYDTAAALHSGYSMCEQLNYSTGDVVAADFFNNTSWTDVPTVGHAVSWMMTAVEELCPWHDHRGESSSPGLLA